MQSYRAHTIRPGRRRSRAALAGTGAAAAVAVAAVVTALALPAGSTQQAGRPSAVRERAARPTLATTPLAGYPGQLPLAGAPRLAVNAIATGDGQRLAAGSAGGHPAIWRQHASGTWTLVTSLPARSSATTLTSIAYGPAGWLAVGVPGPVVLWSAEGTTWRPASGNLAAGLGKITVVSAAAGPRGYVIVGKLAVPGGCAEDVWWSPNLTSWTRARDVHEPAGSSQTLAVAALADGFVSVGSHRGKPAAWITSDGITWRTIMLPGPRNAQLNQVAATGAQVVATGGSDGKTADTPAFAVSSADGGATWRQQLLGLPQPDAVITALAAGNQGFVAAGQYGTPGQQRVAVWELPDATGTWTPARISGITGPGMGRTQKITALAASGHAVTGIGSAAPAANDQAVIFTLPTR